MTPDIAQRQADARYVISRDAARKAGDDPGNATADWPGWQRDLQLAGIYADKVRGELTAAVDTRKLAAQWLAQYPQYPQDSASKAAGDGTAAARAAAAAAIIARARQAVQGALRRVLPAAWTEGWALGQQSARASAQAARAGSPQEARAALAGVDWANWEPGDPEAAARVAGPGLQQLLEDQDVRIKSIAGTRLQELGDVLAKHLSSPETGGPVTYSVDSLAARLKGVLDNPERAQVVAQTEIARAASAAAEDTYRDMGIDRVRLSTAGDDQVCPVCEAAAKRGPVPLGEITVPLHPLCRCALCAALPALKAIATMTAGAPAADPEQVYQQLARNYRPEGIAWVKDMPWYGPVPVPLDRVDWDHLRAWSAARDGAHVARFKAEIEAGRPPAPPVMVQVPGSATLKVIDGHHRSLAYRELGLHVPAWVGLADSDAPTAPWFQAHLYQLHPGADPVSKALGDEDPSRVAFLLVRAVTPDGKWRYLLHKRADDGSWGLPGGTCHDGEVPWDAAVREATEELGDLPPVAPSAVWTRAEDGYVVFTYLVELSDLFAPSADGETAGETAGWGWFRKRDVPDLDLHPAMRETWGALDFGKPLLGGQPAEAAASPAGNYLPAVTAAGQVFPGVSKEAHGYDLKPLSGMISLDVPAGLIELVPGGVDDHHITVVYLGKGLTDEALAEACRRAAAAAALVPGPLAGVLSGRGTFPASNSSDGKVPVWAGVTLPGAEALREALADLSASEHAEWHPHVTLAKVDEGDELPDPVPATPVTFTHLSVHRSDGKLSRFALGGSDAPGEPHQGDKDTCPCGTPVEYDEMNGWQHADGSVSHDDGESVSDKMAGAGVLKMDGGEAGDVRARHLIRWYEEGADGQIHWGEHGPAGDYYQCLAVAGRHMEPDKAKGFCANRHHSVTGQWPGKHAEKRAGTEDPPCGSPGGAVKRGLVPGQPRGKGGHFGHVTVSGGTAVDSGGGGGTGTPGPGSGLSKDTRERIAAARAALPKTAAEWESLPSGPDNGLRASPEAMAHLSAVMTAGEAIHADIEKALERDPAIQAAVGALDFAGARQRSQEIVTELLASVRPFGGAHHENVTLHGGGHAAFAGETLPALPDARDRLSRAEGFFPDDWVRASASKPLTLASSPRAYYSGTGGLLAMPSQPYRYDGAFRDSSDEVTVHELGHRMEDSVPGLTSLEHAYVTSRATGPDGTLEAPKSLRDLYGGGYDAHEMTYQDQWANSYAGKTYGGNQQSNWEVFQVGLQDTFGQSSQQYDRSDGLKYFTLGALATLG